MDLWTSMDHLVSCFSSEQNVNGVVKSFRKLPDPLLNSQLVNTFAYSL